MIILSRESGYIDKIRKYKVVVDEEIIGFMDKAKRLLLVLIYIIISIYIYLYGLLQVRNSFFSFNLPFQNIF